MNGAAKNPDFHVMAHGAVQVKSALDPTIALNGENYVKIRTKRYASFDQGAGRDFENGLSLKPILVLPQAL